MPLLSIKIAMHRKFILILALLGGARAFGELCEDYQPTRTDNIPLENVSGCSDIFLEGYVQALLDMHYFEYQVKVVIKDQVAYLFNMPCNDLVSESIFSFVCDIPGIFAAQQLDYTYDEYCNQWQWENPCGICGEPNCCQNVCPIPPPYYSPCDDVGGIWFPQMNVLFAPPIADPRTVTNSAALRFNDDVVGKHAGAVSFGEQFIVFRWRDFCCTGGDLEWGVEAGIFATFDLDHPKACMFNTDFFVAALFDYAWDKWSWRFRVWHLSAHVGDEFLISNPNFRRRNLSNEGIDLFASYQICRPIRVYAGIGDIFDRDKEFEQHPWYVEWGAEVRILGERDYFNKLYWQPFLAMNFSSYEEHDWNIDQTYALGIEWSKLQGIGRKIRIFVEYHQGHSFEGQFSKHRCSYSALRLTWGF